jgi:hypothetical protein
LNTCIIEYGGGYGANYALVYCDYASPSIVNCVIRYSEYYGVYFYQEPATAFSGNTVTGNGTAPVKINFANTHTIGTGTYTGNQNDYIEVGSATLNGSGTWLKQDVPYLVESGNIENGTLTISPGSILLMGQDASINVNTSGGLIAEGTPTDIITISGYQKQNGWWYYLRFNDGSVDASCRLKYCTIEYGGGYGANYGMVYCDYASTSITYCTIQHSKYWGIYYYQAASNESNNTFNDNPSGNVRVN